MTHAHGPVNLTEAAHNRDMCAVGAGDSVGLPAVPADHLDAALITLAAHTDCHPHLCAVAVHASGTCTECYTAEAAMTPAERTEHVWVRRLSTATGVVAIGCEGYHTPALRAAHQANTAAEAGQP